MTNRVGISLETSRCKEFRFGRVSNVSVETTEYG
jgi:hypothetical protein